MPELPNRCSRWANLSPFQLEQWGRRRAVAFCKANGVDPPRINVVPRRSWFVAACAYYRPDTDVNRKWMDRLSGQSPGINICLEKCARQAIEEDYRNWNWPGSTSDREPYGVIAHELGHHFDWTFSEKKGEWFGDLSSSIFEESDEAPLTSYAPNPAEWFAEMFRLFVTNPRLLESLRPVTWGMLADRWTPLPEEDWESPLGTDVPPKILRAIRNKLK